MFSTVECHMHHYLLFAISSVICFLRDFLLLCPKKADYSAGFTSSLGANHSVVSTTYSIVVHSNLPCERLFLSYERHLENRIAVMLLLTLRNVCTPTEMSLKLHTALHSTSTDNSRLPVVSLQDCKRSEVYE